MVSIVKNLPIVNFSGGLVTNRPGTEIELNQSPDLDNILLLPRGFKKRTGDTAFNATAMNSGANVQGGAYFNGYNVCVCGNKIYQSAIGSGTMTEITGTRTITGGQDNIWTYAKLNDVLIGFGGAPDAPWKWSGSGNAAALGGTPPTADFCFSMKDRVFAGIKSTSTLQWCVLSNAEDWTGVGSGSQVVVTGDDDTLIGGIPLNNDIAILFKNYSMHRLTVNESPFPLTPLFQGIGSCGKNAMVNVRGIIYFITNEARMKATDGYQIIDFPDSIDDLWDGINKTRLDNIQGIYDPNRNLIHWIVSYGASQTTNNYDIIWDVENKCWLRNTTGFDCNCLWLSQGYRLFAGHTDGKIYEKYKASTNSDASETGSGAIISYWRIPWIDIENKFAVKQIRYIDIVYKSQTSGSINYAYGYNGNADTTSGTISQVASGSKWDTAGDLWDSTFVWGEANTYEQKRIYCFGYGNNFQFKVGNYTVGEYTEIDSVSLAYKPAGLAEVSR